MTLNPHGISFSILPSCKASTQVALGGEIWSEPSASDVQKKILEGCSSYSLPTYYLHFMQGQKVMREGSMSVPTDYGRPMKGPSINYVVTKLTIFDPLLLVVFLLCKIGNFWPLPPYWDDIVYGRPLIGI